jgi:hypothetical protein
MNMKHILLTSVFAAIALTNCDLLEPYTKHVIFKETEVSRAP